MEITQEKQKQDYNDDIKNLINIFEFKDELIQLKGSSSMKILNFFADYDFFVMIKHKWSKKEIYSEFNLILRKILENINCYFIEFKLQYINGKKYKWFYDDIFKYEEFNKLFNDNVDFCKIDIVYYSENRFIESSCIYKFGDNRLSVNEYISMLNDDIKTLKTENNYFKILKRLFSIYKIKKDNNKLILLTNFFNSEYGKKYKDINNINAIELLSNHYNNDSLTKKRIELNLNELGFNKKYKKEYNKIYKNMNQEAKKIYLNII